MTDNWRFASGLFFGSWIWILILSLLALALSAWVKWKPAAGALMFGVFFVAGGFGATINGVQRTNWGHMFNISYLIGSVWVDLFEGAKKTTNGALFFRAPRGEELPIWCSLGGLFALCGICLYMLAKKIRGDGGGAMSEDLITFSNVSRFYGEVLGINKVSLGIPPGITSLVGPNGSGKTTLMNLMTGLIRPTQGEISVLGVAPRRSREIVPARRVLRAVRRLSEGNYGVSVHLFVPADVRLQRLRMRAADRGTRCSWSGCWRPRAGRWRRTARACGSASSSRRPSRTTRR